MADFDIVVIGGGIVGLSTAMQLSQRFPGLSLAVLEKEPMLAGHQTGRNSGVIHAGVYYEPGSLKAKFCREGSAATMQFCKEYGIRFDQRGKMLVATGTDELPRMEKLYERALANGLEIHRVSKEELTEREPHIAGLGALFVPASGIVDYGEVTRCMGALFLEADGTIMTDVEVCDIREQANGVEIALNTGMLLTARHVIACAGVNADRLARMCGLAKDLAIIPFRGEYFRLGADKNRIVDHLIYPIPEPSLPFLGVHLTPMIAGFVTVGPNAVLAFARDGYSFGDVDPKDLWEMIRFPGFRRVITNNMRYGLGEMANSLSRRRYLALCQRYCPELELADLHPHPAGIRAQAVSRDGRLLHDFLIERTARTVHVLNAPSPAATSALPIGRYIADIAETHFAYAQSLN
ncbi:L-2-hydroxyglutarate oxidase [Pararhizobium sp. BT-229]|uniref:L-2-hydroxyglutarate oxidase n=1 Tax=Pararhizobium sp. BT-229 TaxID=2986923 RepID=UPI0021F73231|nr:L-2-hydroxyglutarate oxidase [Pararhizobium sp. BT-229]MCV9967681.1 L-2-hydroxyglutarate oxidase [Pararhizobium sp. BT-229]